MLQLEPGVLFADRFQVIKRLGAGGMGAVYLASEARNPEFKIAIKILYPGIIKTREARERFRNEILASYRLHHPNIVRAYEYFDFDDMQAFAMEYVDGGDLASVIAKGPMPPYKAVGILKQLCLGLEAIHQNGIIHRDLKPENILYNSQHVYKISDFGVARMEGNNTLTQAGALVGTPKYLAPEYIERGTCDHRGDIYALGVIAYEMLSGKSPFEGSNKTDMLLDRFKVKPGPKLAREAPNCPELLRHIIERALSVRVSERYQNAHAMYDDLERFERGSRMRAAVSMIAGETTQGPIVSGTRGKTGPSVSDLLANIPRSLVLLCVVASVGAAVYATEFLDRPVVRMFADMQPGVYQGQVTGLMAHDSKSRLLLIKNHAGEWAMVMEEGCSVSPVDPQGNFSCGDLQLRLERDRSDPHMIQGSIQEPGWGISANWKLSAEPSYE